MAVVLGLALVMPQVWAQGFGFGRSGDGMFDSFFSPFSSPRSSRPVEQRPAADFTRAPPPRKLDTHPNDNVLVLGDSMADWLAYGLEDALGDSPDLGVVRKHRASSGLIRYDSRNEAQDWAHVVREAIAEAKPKFVVMMLGLNDRQAIRERVQPARAAAPVSEPAAPPPLVPQAADPTQPDPADAERGAAEEKPVAGDTAKAGTLRTYEFRTEEWAERYSRRIDATIAALKSGNVPVFWVGLPSVRGTRSTSDMLYLNDLFRTRAEKAGIVYIDVWDGFVDENGRYALQGPDFEGQTRRLRVSDGVHFTKAGARKLAHYVEREIRRAMTNGLTPVALPLGEPQTPAPTDLAPGALAARPLSGPIVSLTTITGQQPELAGAGDAGAVFSSKAAARVLVKGDAIPAPAGRSDDFKWPRRSIAPFGTDPLVATTSDPAMAEKPVPPPAVATVEEAKPAEARPGETAPRRPSRRHAQQPQNRRSPYRER